MDANSIVMKTLLPIHHGPTRCLVQCGTDVWSDLSLGLGSVDEAGTNGGTTSEYGTTFGLSFDVFSPFDVFVNPLYISAFLSYVRNL